MAAFQFSSFNLQMAQDYFAHLNPIAQRISADINATKSTYGQIWNTLKANQQNEIINETLIKPEIVLKYFETLSSSSLSSNESLSSSSSANISTTSAEHILQGSTKSRDQNLSPNANNCKTTNLLTDNIIKQTQNLLSNTLTSRAKNTIQTHQFGKLKPPSSPPPPPPITTKLYTKAEKHTKLESQKTLRNELTKTTNEKTNYFYDGTNLFTYVAQKVALKVVYDDALGVYRDEHSQPFSYRAKSQIDLQQHYYETDLGDVEPNTNCDNRFLTSKEPCNVNLVENATLTKNYEQLQKELKSTLNNHLETIRKNEAIDVDQKSGYDMSSKVHTNNYAANKRILPVTQEVVKIPPAVAAQAHTSRTTNKCESKSSRYLRKNNEKHTAEGAFLVDLTPKQTNLTYAVYTDAYFEQGESATLMHNCSNSGILTASSNSSTSTSDEDEHNNYEYDDDDDEKTLCEDIRLLENDLNLRRGFDFLNNW